MGFHQLILTPNDGYLSQLKGLIPIIEKKWLSALIGLTPAPLEELTPTIGRIPSTSNWGFFLWEGSELTSTPSPKYPYKQVCPILAIRKAGTGHQYLVLSVLLYILLTQLELKNKKVIDATAFSTKAGKWERHRERKWKGSSSQTPHSHPNFYFIT